MSPDLGSAQGHGQAKLVLGVGNNKREIEHLGSKGGLHISDEQWVSWLSRRRPSLKTVTKVRSRAGSCSQPRDHPSFHHPHRPLRQNGLSLRVRLRGLLGVAGKGWAK